MFLFLFFPDFVFFLCWTCFGVMLGAPATCGVSKTSNEFCKELSKDEESSTDDRENVVVSSRDNVGLVAFVAAGICQGCGVLGKALSKESVEEERDIRVEEGSLDIFEDVGVLGIDREDLTFPESAC